MGQGRGSQAPLETPEGRKCCKAGLTGVSRAESPRGGTHPAPGCARLARPCQSSEPAVTWGRGQLQPLWVLETDTSCIFRGTEMESGLARLPEQETTTRTASGLTPPTALFLGRFHMSPLILISAQFQQRGGPPSLPRGSRVTYRMQQGLPGLFPLAS